MNATYLNGAVTVRGGDCLDVVKALPDNSIDAVVTDPPYALVPIGKRFGAPNAAPASSVYGRAAAGFMGKRWDTGETAFAVEFWAQVLRVLKPGGHVVAFGGTRSYHRLACAIEDAGFEIRDQLAWVYGTGFPKSHDVAKGIDKALGAARAVVSREKVRDIRNGHGRGLGDGINACERDGPTYFEREITAPATDSAREWQGWGTALKPAWETICLARKPLSEPTVAANVLRWGTGAINVGACRIKTDERPYSYPNGRGGEGWHGRESLGANLDVPLEGSPLGRWPANLVHDGSAEVLAAFPDARSAGDYENGHNVSEGMFGTRTGGLVYSDSGSAARFFYSAKADGDDRLGSKHPTVKPVDLMRWLCRLVTPPGGVILDPFAGTGTTGEAAWREKFSAVLIEREAEYQADIARRMAMALQPPRVRRESAVKARNHVGDAGPLFS